MRDDERQLIEHLRTALDRSTDGLDAGTRARLAQARALALTPRRRHFPRWWLPAGGAVFASVLAATLWLHQPASWPDNSVHHLADLEMLISHDNLELYQELDFYRWLESAQLDAG